MTLSKSTRFISTDTYSKIFNIAMLLQSR